MDDDLRSRRRNAAEAVIARRGYLGMTQEQLATKAGIAPRTVQSFESATDPKWPHAGTRAKMETALDWPPGEIHRLASPARQMATPQEVDRLRELTAEEREWWIQFLVGLRDAGVQERRRGG